MSRQFRNLIPQREAILALILVLMVAGAGAIAPQFLNSQSIASILADTSILVILALAQASVMITRGIDLSIAANLAFSGMCVALIAKSGVDVGPGWSLALAAIIGMALGCLNGLLVAFLALPPIVVTLGTMSVYRGMIYVLTSGASVSQNEMTPAFLQFPLTEVFGLSTLVWLAALAVLASWLVLDFTRFGRSLYALGSNATAAHYVGIPVRRVQFLAYVLCGAMAGACGYLWVARYAIAFTEVAVGLELVVIAACVVGGVSVAGAVGTVPGVVLGALFLGVLGNALPVLRVSPFWQMAISGAVILVAVTLNAASARGQRKRIMPANPVIADNKGGESA